MLTYQPLLPILYSLKNTLKSHGFQLLVSCHQPFHSCCEEVSRVATDQAWGSACSSPEASGSLSLLVLRRSLYCCIPLTSQRFPKTSSEHVFYLALAFAFKLRAQICGADYLRQHSYVVPDNSPNPTPSFWNLVTL